MRFYPDLCFMGILDTDGFSINGSNKRFPARQFSDEYISPEARGMKPEQLGVQQDLFALSVIIFRLLNSGVHPYQGRDHPNTNLPTTLQERIFAGLYCYGQQAHKLINPAAMSIHNYLEKSTRELFDRSFNDSTSRPTALEWRSHLTDLISSNRLVKCAVKPSEHAHFTLGCGLCDLDTRRRRSSASGNHPQTQIPSAVLTKLPSSSTDTKSARLILGAIIATFVIGVFLYLVGGRQHPQTSSDNTKARSS